MDKISFGRSLDSNLHDVRGSIKRQSDKETRTSSKQAISLDKNKKVRREHYYFRLWWQEGDQVTARHCDPHCNGGDSECDAICHVYHTCLAAVHGNIWRQYNVKSDFSSYYSLRLSTHGYAWLTEVYLPTTISRSAYLLQPFKQYCVDRFNITSWQKSTQNGLYGSVVQLQTSPNLKEL